jgi:predicted ATPase/DNA-binding SARP family transcriptional activator
LSDLQVEFRILGPLEAVADGEPLALGGPKQRAVLVELLLRANAVVSRERLLDAIWGDELPKTAVGTLQVYVHGLRRALGAERIETSGSAYRLRLEPDELDLARFERLVEGARDALAERRFEEAEHAIDGALGLWRGAALADLADQGEAQVAARALEERRVEALELRNEVRLALDRPQLVLADLEQLIAEHPYRERLRSQQILALYRSGRQTDALAAYRAVHETWADELGLEPTPALRELERAVLRHEPSLATPAARPVWAGRLPKPATPLVGRRLEIAAVSSLLRSDARLVTLLGPGGTGKTRLAIAVAEALAPELAHGAVFVDLSAVTDPELLVPLVARAAGAGEETVQAVGALLDEREVLLVLDNLEQILPAGSRLAQVLAAAPSLRVLATSRAPLRLSYEHEYPVPPLPLPRPSTSELEELAQNESVRLFSARARAVDPTFMLDLETAPSVAAICRQVDGLPLAIELAAARVKLLGPAEIAARLNDRPSLLAAGPTDAPARHSTLAATIQWSHDLLGEREQATFGRLAIFAGGCTVEAAERVCGADLDVLATLIDNSLVRQRRGAAGPRLLMLETIRRFAVELLEAADDREEIRGRHAEWLTGLAETAETEVLAGGDPAVWFSQLEPEHDNIRAALTWSIQADPIVALRLASALRPFWEVRGHLDEGRRWLEQGLAAARDDVPTALRAKAVGVTGTFAFHGGDFELARNRFAETLELFRELDDADGIARGLSDLGTVAAAVGDLETAGELLQQSADRFRELGERKRLAIVLANIGHVAGQQEDFATAIAVTMEALAVQQELGDRQREAVSLLNLGSFSLRTNDLTGARRWYRESLALAVELGYREVIAYGLVSLVRICLLEDNPRRAAQLAGVADALLAETGIGLLAAEQEAFARAKEEALAHLGADGYATAHDEGRETPVEDALASTGVL